MLSLASGRIGASRFANTSESLHQISTSRILQEIGLDPIQYLFLYLENRDHIHLLYLLDKDEQEDLSNEERKALRALVAQIKETNL